MCQHFKCPSTNVENLRRLLPTDWSIEKHYGKVMMRIGNQWDYVFSLFLFFSFYLPSPYPLSDSQHFSSFFTFRLRPFSLRQSSARRCWSTSMLVGRLRLPKEEDVLRAVGKKSDSDIRSWWLLTLAFLSISKINLNCYFRTSLKSCLKINNLSLSVSLSSFSVVGGGGIWLDF